MVVPGYSDAVQVMVFCANGGIYKMTIMIVVISQHKMRLLFTGRPGKNSDSPALYFNLLSTTVQPMSTTLRHLCIMARPLT